MNIQQYIEKPYIHYKTGTATEHRYRGDLQDLIKSIVTGVEMTNQPSKVTDYWNPGYLFRYTFWLESLAQKELWYPIVRKT